MSATYPPHLRRLALLGLGLASAAAHATFVEFDLPTPLVIPAGGQSLGYYIDLAQFRYTQDPNVSWVGNDANFEPYRRTGTITSMLFAANNGSSNANHVGVDGWLGSSIVGPLSLDPGTTVGPGGAFVTSNGVNSAGAYRQERTGFLGVRFLNSLTQQVNYGWMEFTTTTTSTPAYTAQLNRWGFDDSGAAVVTPPLRATPEPATFAALGMGVLAIVRRRRRA